MSLDVHTMLNQMIVSAPFLMLIAWGVEVAIGWPNWLYQRLKHPVAWIGTLITCLDNNLNRERASHRVRYLSGVVCSLFLIAIVTAAAWLIAQALPDTISGFAIEAIIASSLLASRSLFTHVHAVAAPLNIGDLEEARRAVAQIVGRDPEQLDNAGIARAGLESLAENASDGVIAPLFWGAIFGLPGIAAYKAINTLDSMIGHRDQRYLAFGGFAARLDDVTNFIPARLTSILFAIASFKPVIFGIVLRDAKHHSSLNAGWPEAAMAGALNVRLSGPRQYGTVQIDAPYLNQNAPDPDPAQLYRGLSLYVRALGLAALSLGIIVWVVSL